MTQWIRHNLQMSASLIGRIIISADQPHQRSVCMSASLVCNRFGIKCHLSALLLFLLPSLQEDSSDLKCQLHFAKEESALMCKKLTKLVKDSEAMKEELSKYRSLYGDVDASITVEEVCLTNVVKGPTLHARVRGFCKIFVF